MRKITLTLLISFSSLFAAVDINSCIQCHGADFEKAALGKSKIVKDMTKKEISDALVGYKYKTYGDSLKGVMYSIVKTYTDEELQNTGLGLDKKIHKVQMKSAINLDSCKECHGVDFEKAALGKSKIVKDMTQEAISNALIGYKYKTYGDSLQGVMYDNVVMHSDEELRSTGLGLQTTIKHKVITSSVINLTTCKQCHGVDFEKASLGSSRVVRDMSQNDIIEALLGYKNGTYGGSMKGVMIEKMKHYSTQELKSIKVK